MRNSTLKLKNVSVSLIVGFLIVGVSACGKSSSGGGAPAAPQTLEETFLRACSDVAHHEFSVTNLTTGEDAEKQFGVSFFAETAKRGSSIDIKSGDKLVNGYGPYHPMTIGDMQADTISGEKLLQEAFIGFAGMPSKKIQMNLNVDEDLFRLIFIKTSHDFEFYVVNRDIFADENNNIKSETNSKSKFNCLASNENRALCRKFLEQKTSLLEVALTRSENRTVAPQWARKLSCMNAVLKYVGNKVLTPVVVVPTPAKKAT